MLRNLRTTFCLLSLIPLLAVPASLARGDVIQMKDGRRFEGTIKNKRADSVSIDTKVGWARATVTLLSADIDSIEEKPLPAGFFAAPEPPSSSVELKPGQVPYLEVPIEGRFGTDVFVESVERALGYAKRHRIRHIVFSIDNVVQIRNGKSDGDVDTALELYKLLKRHKESMVFHGVVRNCLGDGMAVALWCDTLRFLPGSRIGGVLRDLNDQSPQSARYQAEESQIIREQMVAEILFDTRRSGNSAMIVRAMLDPTYTLALWKDENGQVVGGQEAPRAVPKNRVILSVPEGELLNLAYEKAIALGAPAFGGDLEKLGADLGIEGWTRESDYGRRAAETVARKNARVAKRKQADYERKAERNITRRQTVEKYIAANFKKAAELDPTKTEYKNYSQRWNWTWGWHGPNHSWSYNFSGAQTITLEKQREYKNRVDNAILYLQRAAKGILHIEKHDEDAVKLGLQPTYAEGEEEKILEDIKAMIEELRANRDPFTKK